MIVRREDRSLLLITQSDHAALAAHLVAAWQADGWPERATRAATLLATLHHDDGWIDEDARPRLDEATGRPFDFLTLPPPLRHAVWRRGVPVLASQSTYAAALVAQHAVTVFRASRTDPAWRDFTTEMERARDHYYTGEARPAGNGPSLDPVPSERLQFLRDYAMLSLGDLLSLIVCNAWTTRHEQDGYAIQLDGAGRLRVWPDPFGGLEVPFTVRARRLPAASFTSDVGLQDAWHAADEVLVSGIAAGGDA